MMASPLSPETISEADRDTVNHLMLLDPPKPDVPRLYYFNARGRAEILRLVFAVKEIHYEDIRCRPHPHAMSDFEVLKKYKRLPFGQVPLLEIDGISLAQSQAILRYLGRKYDLMGDSEIEAAIVDMIEDIRQKFTSSLLHWNDPESQPYICSFKTKTCPEWGGYFERLLEANGGEYFVGKRLTYADLAVYDMITVIQHRIPEAFQQFQLLRKHVERVRTIPQIAKWIRERPETSV